MSIKEIIDKFNSWYDGISEPWRMMVALAIASVPLTLFATAQSLSSIIVGVLVFLIVMIVRLDAA